MPGVYCSICRKNNRKDGVNIRLVKSLYKYTYFIETFSTLRTDKKDQKYWVLCEECFNKVERKCQVYKYFLSIYFLILKFNFFYFNC